MKATQQHDPGQSFRLDNIMLGLLTSGTKVLAGKSGETSKTNPPYGAKP
ncbi:MAG: hypothetical protein ACXW4Z_06755 [Candidatus Binatia bacterium]